MLFYKKLYFFFGSLGGGTSSLKAPRRCLIDSTMLLANSGIFLAPNNTTKTTAIIIISLVPSPNIYFYEFNKIVASYKTTKGSVITINDKPSVGGSKAAKTKAIHTASFLFRLRKSLSIKPILAITERIRGN